MLTYSSHPSSNVSCSPYGDEVEGRGGGTLSHEVVELRESFTTLREDFDDFLRMFEKVTSMLQKRQVIHHEDTPKELPWKKNKILLVSLNEGTLSCDESDATLVDPIDDQVDSSRKINLCPPSVGTCSLNEGTLSCDESDATLVDPIDDQVDSSRKINLCPPSVGTCSLNEGTLSCDESDATLVDPIDDQVDSSRKINLCPPSVGINDLNESLDHSNISCFSHVNLEVECLLKDNLLFDDDMTLESVHSEMPYNVGSVATLSGYQLFENPLWCDDTLSKDGNLFCEDDSTFIGEGSVKMKGDGYV
uniref:Uncharacterized protein n=1 Tax=Solanum tuberosum TaxID=4113 RepID=M1DHX2_SOLTU